jgi:hypothetical protein
MIEYDAHEPGTWRDAALHFRAENERLTGQLAAVTAERDALRGLLDDVRDTWSTLDDIDVFIDPERAEEWHTARNRMDYLVSDHCAALAARGGEAS